MATDRESLIAAIRESPDNDSLRLICADWFETQGGEANVARAEFVRLQVQRAALPIEDLRHSELEARELQLLKKYAPVWCGSHFVFKKCRFRRGFIEFVHLHLKHFLHHRRQMFALEPVRDISLTGWFRAPTDLVRRVAGCEELKYVETLRIHHQGPHKEVGNDLIVLLESPHFTGLERLHCPVCVVFDVDGRRRFEQLPILRHVRGLCLPEFDRLAMDPGSWFSNGTADVGQWRALKSLALPGCLDIDQLFRLSELPFWQKLTGLDFTLPGPANQAFAFLHDRMPPTLRDLGIHATGYPPNAAAARSFYVAAEGSFERLARLPLQRVKLDIPIEPGMLGQMLAQSNLKELTLGHQHTSMENHTQAIARSAGSRSLRSLKLDCILDDNAARALFASEHLRSLVHLDLSGTGLGPDGLMALAKAKGWDRLRSLDLAETGSSSQSLHAFLASPNLGGVTWLGMALDVLSSETGAAFAQLPHLACLRLDVGQCNPQGKRALQQVDSPRWMLLYCNNEYTDQSARALLAPEGWPPVDLPLPPHRIGGYAKPSSYEAW